MLLTFNFSFLIAHIYELGNLLKNLASHSQWQNETVMRSPTLLRAISLVWRRPHVLLCVVMSETVMVGQREIPFIHILRLLNIKPLHNKTDYSIGFIIEYLV